MKKATTFLGLPTIAIDETGEEFNATTYEDAVESMYEFAKDVSWLAFSNRMYNSEDVMRGDFESWWQGQLKTIQK